MNEQRERKKERERKVRAVVVEGRVKWSRIEYKRNWSNKWYLMRFSIFLFSIRFLLSSFPTECSLRKRERGREFKFKTIKLWQESNFDQNDTWTKSNWKSFLSSSIIWSENDFLPIDFFNSIKLLFHCFPTHSTPFQLKLTQKLTRCRSRLNS